MESYMKTNNDVKKIEQFFSEINRCIGLINEEEDLNNLLLARLLLEGQITSGLEEDMDEHPYFLLCDSFVREAMQEVDNCKEDAGEYKYDIRREIVDVRYQNYSKMHVYCDLTDYIVNRGKAETRKGYIPFKEYGSLTEIQDYRLIEKIESLCKDRGLNKIKIACLGNLMRTKAFDLYFKEKKIKIELHEYLYQGKSIFYCEEANVELSIKKMSSLQELLENYDLILFLNESYFYKNKQSDKSYDEQNANLFIDWYWRRYQDAKKENDFSLEAIMCLLDMYQRVLQFQRSAGEQLSGEYEFNVDLLNSLEFLAGHLERCGDIYLYMQNERVANRNIDERDVCKEEYYDGKNLYVYKITPADRQNVDSVNSSSKNKCLGGASVDVWKFIKSISNPYYEEYWGNKYSISDLKDAKVEFVGGRQEDKNRFCVYYRLAGKKTEEIEEYVREILDLASGGEPIACVRKYIKDMIYGAVLSRADSIEGLVLANKIRMSKDVFFEKRDDSDETEMERVLATYSDRKAFYNIIDHLNYLRINDFAQAQRILRYDFKSHIARDLSDSEFESFMREVNRVCKKYGDSQSRVFYYSDVFAEEKR